jgi:hypothetical protein
MKLRAFLFSGNRHAADHETQKSVKRCIRRGFFRQANYTMKILSSVFFAATLAAFSADDFLTYAPKEGAGNGKHIVLLAGDEEYRSEEAMPMLGKLLSQRHGFKCTVLFSVDANGVIDPGAGTSLTNSAALDSADAIVMSLRFRKWADEDAKRFSDAIARGVPIVGLRTSTHAFQMPGTSAFKNLSNFGKKTLGEQWVSHWGRHKSEATRGVIEESAKGEAVLRGVADVFCDSDVYEAYPPADAKILMRGLVLKGMKPEDEVADYKKKRANDKMEQGVNDPAMPVAWTRVVKNEAGKENKILCTTLGAASDLKNEGIRRLVVNGVFWGLGMEVPAKADVETLDGYNPTMYGFGTFRKGLRASDHALGKVLPEGAAPEKK